jgi:NADH:ubiquinone oxidoreductase subunit 3 (subunit A)
MALTEYLAVALFAIVGLLFPWGAFILSKLFRPSKPTSSKDTVYECGEVPLGDAQVQFTFQYYIFALIFAVFDVVAVFLFLFAFIYRDLASSLVPAGVFLCLTLVGLFYALKKEALTWT